MERMVATASLTAELDENEGSAGLDWLESRDGVDVAPFEARYEDRGVMARGGMGEVRVLHDRRIGRTVAAKVVAPTTPRAGVRRFVREARLQGQLEHPSIVAVHDVGVTSEGSVYFTMKQVRGRTLRDILTGLRMNDPEFKARYSRRKLLNAFNTVCLTVAFAHDRGVTHRDLKPANIMLGDFGETYVLDWGIAAPSLSSDTPETSLPVPIPTKRLSSRIQGSPGYMAPEQVMGTPEAANPQVDVYALGAILFEILTLEPLHPQATAVERVESTLEGANARASIRCPEANVPPELEHICVVATKLHPHLRFAGAHKLSDAIEGYLDGDRNLEMRRKLAEGYVATAEQLVTRSPTDGTAELEARGRAMSLLGQAVALDPEHPRATQRIASLLLSLPRKMPFDAAVELTCLSALRARTITLVSLGAHAVNLPSLLLLFIWSGVREWGSIIAMFSCLVAGLVFNVLALKYLRHYKLLYTLSYTGIVFGWALTSRMFGPFIAAPLSTAFTIMCYMLAPTTSLSRRTLGIGAIALFAPWVAEGLHLLPSTYEFRDGGIVILPTAIELSPVPVTLYLLGLSIVCGLVIPALFVHKVQAEFLATEEREQLRKWHLGHLLPAGAREANEVTGSTPIYRPLRTRLIHQYLDDPRLWDAVEARRRELLSSKRKLFGVL